MVDQKARVMVTSAEEADNTVTFLLQDEDHTMGASLVDVLNRSSNVVFAGYTIPHPSERRVQLAIQTTGVVTPKEALVNAAESLQKMCATTDSLFNSKVDEFRNQMQS